MAGYRCEVLEWCKVLIINYLSNIIMKANVIYLYIIILLFVSSCTTTHITSSWREPNKQVTIEKLNKVLVLAWFRDITSCHKAEDEMVAYLKGKGVVSYNYLNDDFKKYSESDIREIIKKDGFDGVITMRLLDVDKERSYTPGIISSYPSYYQTFSGFYYRNLPYYANSGYYFTIKTFTVETNVYSIKENKIIWTGLTETTNPEGVDKMTSEISKLIYKTMLKEGFVSEN